LLLPGSSDPATDPGLGTASFTISGDIEGEREGIANFRAFEMSGVHTWDINILDQSPITYTIAFMLWSDEIIEWPSPGTYNLVMGNFDGTEFHGTYSDMSESSTHPEGYVVNLPGSETQGTLNITSSSENLVNSVF